MQRYNTTKSKGSALLGWLLLVCALGLTTRAWSGVTCDGIDDLANAANEANFSFGSTTPTSWTVELWAKWTAAASVRLVGKGIDTVGGWRINATSGNKIECDLYASALPATVVRGSTTTTLNDGVPHHIACVFTGDTDTVANNDILIYVDGVLDQGAPVKTGTAYNVVTTVVQLCSRNGGAFFNGTMDNLRITAGALSAADILNHAKSKLRLAQDSATVVAYWPMDTCTPAVTQNAIVQPDRAGQGNTVTFDDGANNTGVLCDNSLGLMYPGGMD